MTTLGLGRCQDTMDGFNSPGLLSQVLDASDDQVYVIDTDRWRVIDCNEGACRALGYPKETLVGMNLAGFDANQHFV